MLLMVGDLAKDLICLLQSSSPNVEDPLVL
jgi:hypothetical protein